MIKLVDIISATIVGGLLAVTIAAAIIYYKIIRKAQAEYEKAREIIEDVVVSFNRELRRETGKLDLIAYKIEGNNAKIETGIKKIEMVEKKITPIEKQLSTITEENLGELGKIAGINTKIDMIEEMNNKLKTQVTALDEQLQKITFPEAKLEPVIPIRRDKAMAALTDTEISVLELLSNEGAMTAPEIKEKVQLSREHTARLMKKLYEEGYLERETGKIPFKYSVKKEMESLLRKQESTTN